MTKFVKALNKTKNIVIANKIKVANNPISRIIGLLLNSSLDEDNGIVLIPCRSIHSYMMRFEFDAVFIDKNNTIIHLIEKMQPQKASGIIWKSRKVLELSAGTISSKNIELNDEVIFE